MNDKQLSEIFKSEYSNLIAVLCHYYGLNDIQTAEDIVSDTFLMALKTWSHNGVPDSPKAWLRKVAQNKLNDHYRRQKNYKEKVAPQLKNEIQHSDVKITDDIIEDSQLRMIFVTCDPVLSNESQLCIALRILCGFNIDEICTALLSNKETINKKLYRAKKTIREQHLFKNELSKSQYVQRLDNVIRVIYLLFNEGYYSSVNEANIREEICWEAMRLCIFLTKRDFLPQSKIQALLALMCFHASRLNARTSGEYGDLLYEQQDRSKWNYALIEKGKKYLKLSAMDNTLSKYQIEATIAYWHTSDSKNKWESILQLYNKLLTIEYSPVIALNRTYALAKANSIEEAINEAKKLTFSDNHLHHCLLAELYRMNNNIEKEISYLNKALKCAIKANEKELIKRKLEKAFESS